MPVDRLTSKDHARTLCAQIDPGHAREPSVLAAMGHEVTSSNGDPMGGYQAIHFTPDPSEQAPRGKSIKGDPPVNGVYRAGTDFRKDGEAVGW